MSDHAKRIRSPNYPAISLPQAVAQLKPLFERIHKHPAPKEVVAKGLGYGGWNGASATIVSAHTKYGFLDRGDDDQFKITDRAIRIMFPKDAAEAGVALREAALAPNLYGELVNAYGDTVPHDDILQSWLIRRGFAPTVIGAVIQGYRDTMELVKPSEGEYDSGVETNADSPMQPQSPPPIPAPPPAATTVAAPAGSRQEKISDDEGQTITLMFPSEPTLETYEFVKEYLEFRIARLQKVAKQKIDEAFN